MFPLINSKMGSHPLNDLPATPSPLVRLSFQPRRTRKDQTEGFVYLARLSSRDFSRFFVSLILPAEEWRTRLGAEAFDALPPLPVYIDPITKKSCHLGEDIRAAQRAAYMAETG